MTLATHAFCGAAAACLVPQSEFSLALLLALSSHYALDAIPHWDYELASAETDEEGAIQDMTAGRTFRSDLLKIGADFFLGAALALVVFSQMKIPLYLILAGIGLGVLPDGLQFVYFKMPGKISSLVQKLHNSVHARKKIKNILTGVSLQLLICLVMAMLVFAVRI